MFWVAVVTAVCAGLTLSVLLVRLHRASRVPVKRPPTARRVVRVDAPADVGVLARQGRHAEAVRLLRQHNPRLEASQAKRIVDNFTRRFESQVPAKPAPIIDVRDEDIHREIRENRLFNAIALYREKNGVGIAEAKTAVEALRDRMRAS